MLAGMGEVLPGTGQHDHAGHGAGHGHGHGEHRAGALAGLRHVLRPHSHEAADKVDAAMEASAAGLRALWISLAALAVTAVLQSVVVALSGSVALLGDTLHNAADALTAVPLAIAFLIGRRPPTRRYTYGYGRAEDLAGVVIVLVIAASSVLAAAAAVIRFAHPRPVSDLPAVAAAALIGFMGNELVARYRIRVGRRIGSAALVADGLHARTDGFTSLAVLLGVAGAALGWDWVDQAERTLRGVPGVLDVGQVRLRWIGHQLRAECEIVISPHVTAVRAPQTAVAAEHALLHEMPRLSAALVHADPEPRHGTNYHATLASH